MDEHELAKRVKAHLNWLQYPKRFSNSQLNLTGEYLNKANLATLHLHRAKLSKLRADRAIFDSSYLNETNLRFAQLSESSFVRTQLVNTNLYKADLSYANFRWANFRRTNLHATDLTGTNLHMAQLKSASYSDKTEWPAPTMLLLADWSYLSRNLTIQCMRYDAANHPDPKAFDRWADGGECPYDSTQWERCINFKEKASLWIPGQAKSAIWLAQALLKECCTKRK